MSTFTESVVEEAALDWLAGIGWSVKSGTEIAPDTIGAERSDYSEVVLTARLRDALARLNPALPAEALGDAFRKVTRPEGVDSVARNRAMHRLLVDGITVEYRTAEGEIRGAQARVLDFGDPANNDLVAVNQFSVVENKHSRRPDVVLFLNGLALAVLELKNAADERSDRRRGGRSQGEAEDQVGATRSGGRRGQAQQAHRPCSSRRSCCARGGGWRRPRPRQSRPQGVG